MPLDTASQLETVSPTVRQSTVEAEPQQGTEPSRWRRNWRWWLLAGVAVVLLVFLPPLLNANRYQRQITRSMSLSLGRPVHLDNVSLHLLPWPGLTLSNFVVSEDPAFGSEPTIRANTVEATLRLSSLWRRRVEFSTVRFVEPSVNLVRNAEGRWNLAEILLHAAQVKTAPTVQRRAGPAPRFPYIEATGGRVNLKLVDEKLPYSLTEADFALWQPFPHQWRVRLRGQPDRTDANLTEVGLLHLGGDLFQATTGQPVHVNLRADWHDAPLGQASLLLLGSDLGWRGRLNVEASLAGTLEQAAVASKITLGGLRRAEFAPAMPLDLQVTCGAGLSIATAAVRQLLCTMPDDAAQPASLTVPALSLQHPAQASATLTATAVPTRWGLQWAALFSPRVATNLDPGGTLDLDLTHNAAALAGDGVPSPSLVRAENSGRSGRAGRSGRSRHSAASARLSPASPAVGAEGAAGPGWQGSVQLHLPAMGDRRPGGVADAAHVVGAETASGDMTLPFRTVRADLPAAEERYGRVLLRLPPSTLQLDKTSSLVLSGTLLTGGYSFSVAGEAEKTVLLAPARYLPPLGDGLDAVLPTFREDAAAPVDFACSAAWGEVQVCALKGRSSATGAPRSRSR